MIQSTLQFFYEFDVKLNKALKESGEKWRLKLSMKENLLRITEKIQEYAEENKQKKGVSKELPGWMCMKDMIRACLVVESVEELWGAFEWINKADYFRIL